MNEITAIIDRIDGGAAAPADRGLNDMVQAAEDAAKNNDHATALEHWLACFRTSGDGGRPRWYAGLGDALLGLDRAAQAYEVFEQGAAKFRSNQGLFVGMARAAMAMRRWGLAVDRWRITIDSFPDQKLPHWWAGLGTSLITVGKLDEAEAHYEQMLERFPEAQPGYHGYARVAMERKDFETAARRMQDLLSRFPGATAPEFGLAAARALRQCGRFAEADRVVQRFLEKHPRNPQLLIALAQNAALARDYAKKQTRWEEALAANEAAIKRSPQYAAYQLDLQTESGKSDDYEIKELDSEDEAVVQLNALSAHRMSLDVIELSRVYARKFPSLRTRNKFARALSRGLTSAADLEELLTETRSMVKDYPRTREVWLERANALIAANDAQGVDRVASHVCDAFGRGGDTDALRSWIAAKRGDFHGAQAVREKIARNNYTPALHAAITRLERVDERPLAELDDKIILFACLRNEITFLPWFLEYYRSIGVDRFVFIDNNSDDGSREYLLEQPDAMVYATDDNFFAAHSGMRWINELMTRHGRGNWCVFVDLDEELVVPGIENGGLRPVLDRMTERGEKCLAAFMLDTYPRAVADMGQYRPGMRPRDLTPLFDKEHYVSGNPEPSYRQVRGGMRTRVFGLAEVLEKTPIVRGGQGALYTGNHTTLPLPVASVSGVLLHHKMLRDGQTFEAIDEPGKSSRIKDRNPACQRRYLRYRDVLQQLGAEGLVDAEHSVSYESSDQLVGLGLMRTGA